MTKSSDKFASNSPKRGEEKPLTFPSGEDFFVGPVPRVSEEEFARLSAQYLEKAVSDPNFEKRRLARKVFAPFVLK